MSNVKGKVVAITGASAGSAKRRPVAGSSWCPCGSWGKKNGQAGEACFRFEWGRRLSCLPIAECGSSRSNGILHRLGGEPIRAD